MGLRKQCCPVSNRLPRYSNAYSEAAENVTGGGCGRFERVKPLCFDLAGFAAPILKIPRIGKTSKKSLFLFQKKKILPSDIDKFSQFIDLNTL